LRPISSACRHPSAVVKPRKVRRRSYRVRGLCASCRSARPSVPAEVKGGGGSVSSRKRGIRAEVRPVRKIAWLGVALLLAGLSPARVGAGWRKDTNELDILNRGLHGKVIDHTANQGVDRRIWSRSLYQRRDLYVYLPPNYDPNIRYPFMLWLHGFAEDE